MMANLLARLGVRTMDVMRGLGHSAFFLAELLRSAPSALKRFYLTVSQVHAIGNYSLVFYRDAFAGGQIWLGYIWDLD